MEILKDEMTFEQVGDEFVIKHEIQHKANADEMMKMMTDMNTELDKLKEHAKQDAKALEVMTTRVNAVEEIKGKVWALAKRKEERGQ